VGGFHEIATLPLVARNDFFRGFKEVVMDLKNQLIKKIKDRLVPERREFPRYEIKEIDQIKAFFCIQGVKAYLSRPEEMTDQERFIINLSRSGIALFLLDKEDPEYFRENPRVTLRLEVEGHRLDIPCEAVYILAGIKRIGLRFTAITDEQLEVISRFLDIRFLAESIKEVEPEAHKFTCENCRWFHGQNSTDLFSWMNKKGGFDQHTFIFGDDVVEWTQREGVKTGRVYRPDFAMTYTILFSREPNPINFDDRNDREKMVKAVDIVKLADIDLGLKRHFLDQIQIV